MAEASTKSMSSFSLQNLSSCLKATWRCYCSRSSLLATTKKGKESGCVTIDFCRKVVFQFNRFSKESLLVRS